MTISGGSNLYAVLRAKPSQSNDPKVIHVLNTNSSDVQNITVTVTDSDFFGSSDMNAVLYRPDENPQNLKVTNIGNGKHEIYVPKLGVWGIIRVIKADESSTDKYDVPAPWSGISIGNSIKDGSASYNSGSYTVKSNGNGLDLSLSGDIYGSTDQLSMVYQHIKTVEDHDYDISARLSSQTGGENGSLLGIMLRETPASNSRFVSLVYEKGYGLKMMCRNRDDAHIISQDLGAVQLPVYLKIQRRGQTYYAYKSSDGLDWGSSIGSYTLDLSKKIGGICASSNSESVENIGVFDSVNINFVLVDDNFNGQTTGNAPKGWLLVNQASGSIAVAEVPGAADKSMKVYDNSNSLSVSAYKKFESQSTSITAEFDFMMPMVKEGALVCYLQDGSGTSAVSILAGSSSISYFNGSTQTNIQTYTANTWYRFKIVADPETDKLDIYIDGVLKVNQGNFRNAVSELSRIQAGGTTSGTDVTAYWDNVRVY